MSSSSYISQQLMATGGPGSASSSRDGNNNNNFMNGDNLLNLALKKPKSWKWELTTSSSTPNISFPKIQLFDSRTGKLMVSVNKPDCVVKSEEVMNGDESLDRKNRDQRYRRSRSTCIREKITTSSENLSDVFEQLQNKGMGHKLRTSVTQYRVEEDEAEEEESGYSLQKSRSANEIRRNVSLEQKKKIRKSPSCRSGSILGRISECYKSSTEEEPPRQPTLPPPAPMIPEISVVEEQPEPKPTAEENKNKIYKLVRSNVGTLIVREESFHTQRSLRRRRQLEAEQSIAENEPQVDKRITITDIPDSSYNDTIKEIDNLISKVMLSHNLQDVQEPRGRSSAQNGKSSTPMRRRRSRRSASAGSNASSCGSGSRRSRNSPQVTVPLGSSSSSSDEDMIALVESRFGSLKRRGRAKYKRNSTGTVQEAAISNGGGLVNGRKQQESNVRRSSISKITSNSSTTPTTTNTVEIQECESFSLSSFRASLAAAAAAKRQRSSEKSSSTSLSTLSPPSPVAESLGEEKLTSSSCEPRVTGDRERSLEKVGDPVELCSKKIEGEGVVSKIGCVADVPKLSDDQEPAVNEAVTTSSVDPVDLYSKPVNGEVNGFGSVSDVQGIPVTALVAESNGDEKLSNELETDGDQKQFSVNKADSVEFCSKQVNGEVLVYSSFCKVGDVLEIPANSTVDVLNCEPLPVREFDEKDKLSSESETVNLQTRHSKQLPKEGLMVAKSDSMIWNSNALDVEKEVDNVATEISDKSADRMQQLLATNCVDSLNKTLCKAELSTRDLERSPMNPVEAATVDSRILSSQKLDNEAAKTDLNTVDNFRKSPSKDCPAIQESEELKVTAADASPRKSPSFGSFRFPQYINGPNESPSSSLAWSYLPHLATSHSTSSLASLRARPTPENSSDPPGPQSQSTVQRRQLKSYARRHHRSSFQLLP